MLIYTHIKGTNVLNRTIHPNWTLQIIFHPEYFCANLPLLQLYRYNMFTYVLQNM